MSLFKARDWWSTKVGANEEFDLGCMAIGCLCNSGSLEQQTEQIAVGSFFGLLRIYHASNSGEGFKPEQLLIEQKLDAPIIQLACGKFASALDATVLAVLHSRRLSVFSLSSTLGAVSHGAQYKLQALYSHNLHRAAFNMCYGPFGQVQGKDFLCVQSMDGTLSVFEQESFSFTRFLPDSLLPGPLAYVSSTDSFVTVSSARNVESYKYQVLAVATETKTKEDAQSLKSGKRVAADWVLCIGEQAISIEVLASNANDVSILVLGERGIYCLSEFGKLKFMKKLEYTPRCMKLYGQADDSLQYMIATHTSTLMIYSGALLKWAAQLNHIPVHIELCKLGPVGGGIAALDENGHLSLHYLGTDPAMMVMPSTQFKDTKYDEYAEEIKRYQQVIREKSSTQSLLPSKVPEDDVRIKIEVPPSLDSPSRAHDMYYRSYDLSANDLKYLIGEGYGAVLAHQANGVEYNDEDIVPSLTVRIEVRTKMMTSNVKVNIHLEKPLAVDQTEYEYSSIGSGNPVVIKAPVYMKYNFLPALLNIKVTATYQSSTGAPRITQESATLPLKLVVKAAPPVKTAMFKVTIDTNKPPVNLNDLFPELLGMNAGGQGAALGFQFYGGPIVTMLASKTSQRYRLQSDDFASMWLLTKDLIDRLHGHFGRNSGLKCSNSGSLPLQEYFESLDAHFEYRIHSVKYRELLDQKALQFRAIQRRLLTRFKDKTPAPLAYLDTLLEGTFRQLLAIAEHAENNKKTLYRASTNLSSSTRLLSYLIKLSCDLSDDDYSVLQSVLTPEIIDSVDHGWEEIVDTALTHQLRTTLSKTAKDHNVNTDMINLGGDTTKLKKHIAIFIERLSKGAKLAEKPSAGNDEFDIGKSPQKAAHKVLDKRNIAEPGRENSVLGAADTPIGTRLGELSPRGTAGLGKGHKKAGLPPLNGSVDDGDVMGHLPPLSTGKLKPLKPANIDVPDLDELTNGTT